MDLLICTPGRLHDLVNKPDKYTGQADEGGHCFDLELFQKRVARKRLKDRNIELLQLLNWSSY